MKKILILPLVLFSISLSSQSQSLSTFEEIWIESADFKNIGVLENVEIPQANKSLAWQSSKILFEKGGEYVLGMPTKQPKNLNEYLERNKIMVSDKMGKYNNMAIKKIKLQNDNN